MGQQMGRAFLYHIYTGPRRRLLKENMEIVAILLILWTIISIMIASYFGINAHIKIISFSNLLKRIDYKEWEKQTYSDELGKGYHHHYGVIDIIFSKTSKYDNDKLNSLKISSKKVLLNFISWLVVSLTTILIVFIVFLFIG
jgi:choline-glycine betaine transporter